MRIVLASSEAVPFSKTGGLADVCGALTKALSQSGHQVWLITPHYPQARLTVDGGGPEIHDPQVTITAPVAGNPVTARLLWSRLPGCDAAVLLIDEPRYFDRPGLYQHNGADYKDNCERFVFFSRAALETSRRLLLRPDIIHAHDWQTGLVPALLDVEGRRDPVLAQAASVFTIHNLSFQGKFWHWDMLLTGLDWKYFNWRQMESFGYLNLLKTGITFADLITTVSPTYAREIQTPEFGCGLQGVLANRRDDLVGILNGVDTEVWNPQTDPHLPRNYGPDDFAAGKAVCKGHLQQRLGLTQRSEVPLFAMVSRMTDQKGFDLITGCAEEILQMDLQLVFLGTGELRHETALQQLSWKYPGRVSVTIGFDEPLSHQIEAGADAYLMPSLYEPCGLNQMYSLIYGTVPIVRAVGGLADSVVDATPENLAAGTANGFTFTAYNSGALAEQVRRAVGVFHDTPTWHALIRNGMRRDFSWKHSAAEYVDVYRRALARRNRVPPPAPVPAP